jgi:peptide/nickel transport system ATP-binding protein
MTPLDPVSLEGSALLRVRGLTVTYSTGDRQSAPALRHVSFDIAPGEIVGVLGESGSGKSTLALSVLGLLPSNCSVEGAIVFQDEDLLQIDASRWREIRGAKISMIYQEPGLSLSPVMRVGDQVAEIIRAHRSGNRKTRKLECEAILRGVRLSQVDRVYRAYPHQLSGGQLHRVAIAQALACRPDLVIADESTRSLDVTVQTEVLNLLRDINRKRGAAFIFITHNPALLAGFADRVIVMYAGGIVEQGPTAQVFSRPLHPYTKGLLQLIPRSRNGTNLTSGGRLPVIPGSLAALSHSSRGCLFEPRCLVRSAVCQNESPSEVTLERGRRVSCFNYGN